MKAFVLGLDGATFSVLTPLMEAGYLPNLQRALSGGVHGSLLSTIPPITGLAWPTFMTGTNPGRHGLLGWQEPLNERFERPWISGRQVHRAKLWHLAGQAGLRVCVYNVPVSFPPEQVNGVMVTGMLTPSTSSAFTYPSQLRVDLLAAFPAYKIDIDTQHTERDSGRLAEIREFLAEAIATTQTRGDALHWLIDREEPDLTVAVFEMPDRLQHVLWKYIAALPAHAEALPYAVDVQQELLSCFSVLDAEIGKVVERIDHDGYLVLLSDHGFGPIDTIVHLNHWLVNKGWLEFSQLRAGNRELLRRLGRVIRPLLPASLMRTARASFTVLQTIEWAHTQAYAGLPSEYGIFLNLHGREPSGVVEQTEYESVRDTILHALQTWTDPRSGTEIIDAAYRREEIYSGPYVEKAPDILFEFVPGYRVAHLPFQGDILQDVSAQPWGFHERAGVYGIRGPGIKASGSQLRIGIEDIMPTLLYALGLPVPTGLDGKVRLELFEPEWQSAHKPNYEQLPTDDMPNARPSSQHYSDQD